MCKTFPFLGSERGYEAIKKFGELQEDRNKLNRETIHWFYTVLNILDAKANSLLRVNSLFITLLVFFWGAARTQGNPFQIPDDQVATAVLALITVTVSTIFCFLIVRVNWKFLGTVGKVKAKIDNKDRIVYDFQGEAKRLARVVDNRTHYYWMGWLLTFVAVLLPALLWLHLMPAALLKFVTSHVLPPGPPFG